MKTIIVLTAIDEIKLIIGRVLVFDFDERDDWILRPSLLSLSYD